MLIVIKETDDFSKGKTATNDRDLLPGAVYKRSRPFSNNVDVNKSSGIFFRSGC